jgi:broad specificity phosphatase PhoE
MGVLFLLRHGQASLGAADYDRLSDLGRDQAQLAGTRLAAADVTVDRVVCGSLTRQRDTAVTTLAAMNRPELAASIDERLDEYDHGAVLAAHTSAISFETANSTAESARKVQSALDDAITKWAAGNGDYVEPHADFIARVREVVAELAGRPGCTLAVTSGGVIAVATAQLLGMAADQWPVLARVSINASFSKVITGRAGSHLVTFNDHAHLEHDRALITYR